MPVLCAGCRRRMVLKDEQALWRAGDGRIWGRCCWSVAAEQSKEPK